MAHFVLIHILLDSSIIMGDILFWSGFTCFSIIWFLHIKWFYLLLDICVSPKTEDQMNTTCVVGDLLLYHFLLEFQRHDNLFSCGGRAKYFNWSHPNAYWFQILFSQTVMLCYVMLYYVYICDIAHHVTYIKFIYDLSIINEFMTEIHSCLPDQNFNFKF